MMKIHFLFVFSSCQNLEGVNTYATHYMVKLESL